MGIVKLAAALVALSMLAGCNSTSSRNSWQTRVENYFMNPARSCASGYYDCTLRSSNRTRDQTHKPALKSYAMRRGLNPPAAARRRSVPVAAGTDRG